MGEDTENEQAVPRPTTQTATDRKVQPARRTVELGLFYRDKDRTEMNLLRGPFQQGRAYDIRCEARHLVQFDKYL